MRSVAAKQERSQAARQIQRSMKAWRERASEGGDASSDGVKIPSGGGAPLPGAVKRNMEHKLGEDLSDVAIHTSGESADAADGLNARAFTTGRDVHFGRGQFDPSSKDGTKLLAHELTHVVQAKRGGEAVARSAEPEASEAPVAEHEGESLAVSDPNEPAEQEADEVAEAVTTDEETADAEMDSPDVAAKSPSIATKLKGVGRKVFRHVNEAGGDETAKLEDFPPAGDPDRATKEQAESWKQRLDAAYGGGSNAASGELAQLLLDPQLDSFLRDNTHVAEVATLSAEKDRTFDAVETTANTEMGAALAAVDAVDAAAPDAAAQLEQAKTHPLWTKWKSHPIWGEQGSLPGVHAIAFATKVDEKQTAITEASAKQENAAPNATETASGSPPDSAAEPTTTDADSTTTDATSTTTEPAATEAAPTDAPSETLSPAERDKRWAEMNLKNEQKNELIQTLRTHVAKLKTGWKIGKTGVAAVMAPVGSLLVTKAALAGAAAGLSVGGPVGALVGGFLAGGGTAITAFLGGNKIKAVLDKPVEDFDAALETIERSLEAGDINAANVELALALIRSKEIDVREVFDTLRTVAAAKAEADKTAEQLAEEKRKAEEEKKKNETLGDKASEVGEGALDVVANVGQTSGASVDAVVQAAGVLKELSGVAAEAGRIGGNAEWVGVGITGVRATLEAAEWKASSDALPRIREDVDRLRLELGLPPLDLRDEGQQ